MAALPQVDVSNTGIRANVGDASFDQDAALDKDGDALGEAEYEVHVVLDDEHGDILGQAFQQLEQALALGRRHAGDRLVEKQNLRLERQRQRDLDLAALTVRDLVDAASGKVHQTQRAKALGGLGHQ